MRGRLFEGGLSENPVPRMGAYSRERLIEALRYCSKYYSYDLSRELFVVKHLMRSNIFLRLNQFCEATYAALSA